MERKEELKELAELKQQIRLLHEKLDRENIINRNHIQKAMKKNISNINRQASIEIIVTIFALINFLFIFSHLGFSIPFMTVTCIGLLSAVIFIFIYHRNIFRLNSCSQDLLTVAYELSRLKQRYASWRKYSIPCAIGWVIWICYECYKMNNEVAMSMAMGCLVGAIIGGVIGTRLYYRQINCIDEILKDIEELRRMEE